MNKKINYWVYPAVEKLKNKAEVNDVLQKFCELTKTNPIAMRSKSRLQSIREKRQVFHYIAFKYIGFGCAEIGNVTNRSHATVLHSCKIVESQDRYFKSWIDEMLPNFTRERNINIEYKSLND